MESNIHSKIVITSSTIILASVFLIVIAGISTTTTFVKVNAQCEGANQTMQQQEDPQQVANQTMEKAIQSANETGKDVGKVGSKVTEEAKDLVGNIGEKLQDLGK
jgi:translation elongation factor EF-Ts